MARKKIAQTRELGEIQGGILKSINKNVEDLYRKHASAIDKVMDDSDEKKVTVNFAIQIDCSDSAPKVKTRIRYSETVTDELIDSLEDPNQPTLFDPPTPVRGRPKKTTGDGNEPGESE
jgi:hypothetical protein